VEADISPRSHQGVLGTEEIAPTAIQLLNSNVTSGMEVGIAGDGIGRPQNQVSASGEAAVWMVQGGNLNGAIALQQHLIASGGQEWMHDTVSHLQRILGVQGQVSSSLELPLDIQCMGRQGQVLSDG
jgi:hypothetical protein